jgi:hypothetical protein
MDSRRMTRVVHRSPPTIAARTNSSAPGPWRRIKDKVPKNFISSMPRPAQSILIAGNLTKFVEAFTEAIELKCL